MQRFIKIIENKSPMQAKRINKFLSRCGDQIYWKKANEFADNFLKYLENENISIDYAVDCYLQVCEDMIKEQIYFLKTGRYSCSDSADAYNSVYSSIDIMKPYMIGIALSQFLWENHYKMYSFFNDIIIRKENIKNYLEIGAGHGLFVASAINYLNAKKYSIIDLSPISLSICKRVVPFFTSNDINLEYVEKNALNLDEKNKYDFITMGEVIEHVNDPYPLVKKVARLLNKNGTAFLTTCANAPAIDHVFLFNNVEEIRELIINSGLLIKNELILQVERCTNDEKFGINYAAEVTLIN